MYSVVKPLNSYNLDEGRSLLLEARAKGNPLPRAMIHYTGRDGTIRELDSTVLKGGDDTIIISYHIPEVRGLNYIWYINIYLDWSIYKMIL